MNKEKSIIFLNHPIKLWIGEGGGGGGVILNYG